MPLSPNSHCIVSVPGAGFCCRYRFLPVYKPLNYGHPEQAFGRPVG